MSSTGRSAEWIRNRASGWWIVLALFRCNQRFKASEASAEMPGSPVLNISSSSATLRNKQIVIAAPNCSSFHGFGAGEKNAHIPASNKTVCVGSVLLPSVIFEESHLYRRCFPASGQSLSSASLRCSCCTCNYQLASQLASFYQRVTLQPGAWNTSNSRKWGPRSAK